MARLEKVPQLTNVHEAMQNAVTKDRDKVILINANFKVHPIKKEIAEQICEKHGTSLSAFLRECVEGLVKDYTGQDEEE